MHPVLNLLMVILAATATDLTAADFVQLHLRSGAIITGQIVAEHSDSIEVTTTIAGRSGSRMSATVSYQRADIQEMTRVADPEETYRSTAAGATTADSIAALARWCFDQHMPDHALAEAKRAIGLDPTQAAAIAVLHDLAWVVVDGQCEREADWLTAQGKVRYHGTIMTIAAATALQAQELAQHAQTDAAAQHQRLTARVDADDRQLSDIATGLATVAKRLTSEQQALEHAQALQQREAATKAAFDAAENTLADAQAASRGQPGAGASTVLIQARVADDQAQHAYLDAKEAAAGAAQNVAQLQAVVARDAGERDRLTRQRATVAAQRDADRAQLDRLNAPGSGQAGAPPAPPAAGSPATTP